MRKSRTEIMNNVYPIHVKRSVPQPFKVINWKLHNVCNYSCSFCGKENNSGNERWLPLEKYKSIVDKIAEACLESPFYIVYTGGEPTLYPDLIELLQYSKNKGAWNILASNGSRTMRWRKELAKIDTEMTNNKQQTAVDKAKELIDKMTKQYALIAVEEIIYAYPHTYDMEKVSTKAGEDISIIMNVRSNIGYWQEVKQEIEKL